MSARRSAALTGLAASWLAVAACGGSTPPPTQSAPTTAEAAGPEPDRGHHMLQTFWMAVDARDALIDGDLERAKTAARALAHYNYGDAFPPDWKHWVGEMQQLADEAALAGNVDEAAQAIGALGVTCGNCHWQQLSGPRGPRTEPEPWHDPPDEVTERMQRHQLAAEDLWAGLITPSEEAWRNGTITLTRAPIEAPQEQGDPVDPQFAERVEAIRELGQRARTVRTHGERGQIYGQLIATCAHCHNSQRRSVP